MSPDEVTPWVLVYLRNHEAAARGGSALFGRAARSRRDSTQAAVLRRLHQDVRADLEWLRQLMGAWDARPNPVLAAAAQLGERVGRLKPNGRLLRRSPLTDLMETEALIDAVWAKRSGWQALRSAGVPTPPEMPTLTELVRRADSQLEQLADVHRDTAVRVFSASGGR
ncbi:MAG: hypothetical protein ACR2LI_06325 [Propionibacteriaceae bacterium]